jgi:hypothetical protein
MAGYHGGTLLGGESLLYLCTIENNLVDQIVCETLS